MPAKSNLRDTKTISQIIFQNVFNLFNALNLAIALLVLIAFTANHEWRTLLNLAFMGVVVANTAIGIIQEIRAKLTIDALRIITTPHIKVRHGDDFISTALENLSVGQTFLLEPGDQVCVDAVLLQENHLEINESMLTGESNAIQKKCGDSLMSGSFVVAGTGEATITACGTDTYAAKLTSEAKASKNLKTKLQRDLNHILRFVTILIVPAGLALFCSAFAYKRAAWPDLLISTSGAMIGMIPEGLILLTSVAFAVGIVRLGKKGMLVQRLSAIESLARINVLCLDKTGTLTTGKMQVTSNLVLDQQLADPATFALRSLLHHTAPLNATGTALELWSQHNTSSNTLSQHPYLFSGSGIPFASSRKWSAWNASDGTAWLLGASDRLLNSSATSEINEFTQEAYAAGNRLLVLAKASTHVDESTQVSPDEITPVLLFAIQDEIRMEIKETLRFFAAQDVSLKIISGDAIETVSAIARSLDFTDADKAKNLSEISWELNDPAWQELVRTTSIFGRVTPEQKKTIVLALQANGQSVAMTGDGVNDVLALKQANCAVAIAEGSSAASAVADLVLLKNDLGSMVDAVFEGRRVINNLERVAALFLTKTIYASLLALIFVFMPIRFPFMSIQLTLVNALCIGIPSFILALRPNKNRVTGNFLQKVMLSSLPIGITTALVVTGITLLRRLLGLSFHSLSTLCLGVLATGGFFALAVACRPFNKLNATLFAGCLATFLVALSQMPRVLRFTFNNHTWLYLLAVIPISVCLMLVMKKLVEKIVRCEL